MADVNALVVFYSRYGEAERLALAAGVGALQGRANIRLRRLEDPADESEAASDERRRTKRDRMLRDYVVPRPVDHTWADVIVFASSSSGRQVHEYIASIAGNGTSNTVAALLCAGRDATRLVPLYSSAAAAGLIVVP